MTDTYNEETHWIKIAAQTLSDRFSRSYSLILYRGEDAYRRGCDNEQIAQEMMDYCAGKEPLGAG